MCIRDRYNSYYACKITYVYTELVLFLFYILHYEPLFNNTKHTPPTDYLIQINCSGVSPCVCDSVKLQAISVLNRTRTVFDKQRKLRILLSLSLSLSLCSTDYNSRLKLINSWPYCTTVVFAP